MWRAHSICILASEIYTLELPLKASRPSEHIISFTKEDAQGIQYPHDDPLVVTLAIANFTTHCIQIDTISSADILFTPTYDTMKLRRNKLQAVNSPLVGFTDDKVIPCRYHQPTRNYRDFTMPNNRLNNISCVKLSNGLQCYLGVDRTQ